MNVFTQEARLGRLTTVLGSDALVLLRMDGTEELSGDFEWRVEALSTENTLDLSALLGTHATVEINHAQGVRAFDGIVCEAEQRGAFENGFRYDLTLRPWLHVASLRRNMRIFHNKTVIEIVQEVLSSYAALGNPHLEVRVMDDYPVLEYTVQYGELDADFIRRQLERFGITWSWRHEAGSHTLLLTDAAISLPEVPGSSRPYFGVAGYHRNEEEHFRHWSATERITTGAVRLTEYNFKIPTSAQEVDQFSDASHPSGDIESYDWPGDYLNQGEGRGVVSRRLEAERGQAPRHRAEGDVVSLGAGWRVTLAGNDVPNATGRTFVCLKATHRFRAQAYGSGSAGADDAPYDGSYVLTPDDAPFRPERRTVGPRVQGPETAVVVGEGEIDCDEHGRILCRFHWDLDGAHSMRVRVSQNWASKGWGGMVIPRIGMEVIVEHLRGDPDKPIVTGCVYNGRNKPPYELPKHKTRSTFRTDTHKGEGYNELRFEDEKGREEIHLHAQLDHSLKVLNHQTNRVDRTKVESIGAASLREVRLVDVHNIGMDMTVNVGTGSHGGFVRKPLTDNPQGIRMAAYNFEQSFPDMTGRGTYSLTAASAIALTAGTTFNKSVGTSATLTYGENLSQTVQQSVRETTGKNHSQVVGEKYRLDAHKEIHLRCGASELIMKADGTILINGKDMTTTLTGNLTDKAAGSIKMNASKIDLN
ncbi:type VI secretion system tip protein TssI/VgrG [Tritonibacter scottomollicae]|uniref:Type VI secretion system tip protein TssI/VgrG n=1 Tax=Tritonibacter scottomollicae TaxID=483013 RepID=A0ABZ0HIJ8_TRISK|nr:type VI secretion system tip protein TssI/VgrG [Tritonibacter scottomollicae]WOI33785.1 type VI secretion system tip protein TssI/VgrG [Tritonibacter scottomollicae]